MNNEDLNKDRQSGEQRMEHTQPLQRISPDAVSQQTRLLNVNKVRELDPIEVPRQPSHPPQYPGSAPAQPKQEKNGRGRMIALLAAGFLGAAFLGAAVSGYLSEQQAKKAALDNQHLTASQQLQEADSQQAGLSQRRTELEAQYEQLLAQQKEAQSLADKLQGQQLQQEKAQEDKSAAGKVLEKITGDAGRQKQQAADTAGQAAEAKQKLQTLNQSVQAASAAIDEVDAQLGRLESMRQQAKAVKADVDRAYSENKDMIDTVLHYAALGFDTFKGIFAN